MTTQKSAHTLQIIFIVHLLKTFHINYIPESKHTPKEGTYEIFFMFLHQFLKILKLDKI